MCDSASVCWGCARDRTQQAHTHRAPPPQWRRRRVLPQTPTARGWTLRLHQTPARSCLCACVAGPASASGSNTPRPPPLMQRPPHHPQRAPHARQPSWPFVRVRLWLLLLLLLLLHPLSLAAAAGRRPNIVRWRVGRRAGRERLLLLFLPLQHPHVLLVLVLLLPHHRAAGGQEAERLCLCGKPLVDAAGVAQHLRRAVLPRPVHPRPPPHRHRVERLFAHERELGARAGEAGLHNAQGGDQHAPRSQGGCPVPVQLGGDAQSAVGGLGGREDAQTS